MKKIVITITLFFCFNLFVPSTWAGKIWWETIEGKENFIWDENKLSQEEYAPTPTIYDNWVKKFAKQKNANILEIKVIKTVCRDKESHSWNKTVTLYKCKKFVQIKLEKILDDELESLIQSDEDTDRTDIDKEFDGFEKSTKEKIVKEMLNRAFPSLNDIAIQTIMIKSNIKKNLNLTPMSMVQDLQQIINRVSRVKGIIPVHKLDSPDEIASAIESEYSSLDINSSSTHRLSNVDRSAKTITSRPQKVDLGELKSSFAQEMQEILTLLSKPNVNESDLKAIFSKLMRIYEDLEKETGGDPFLKQQIEQLRNVMSQFDGSTQGNSSKNGEKVIKHNFHQPKHDLSSMKMGAQIAPKAPFKIKDTPLKKTQEWESLLVSPDKKKH